jgi:hypothetical protein|tara:strand:- start:253 stop:411 length:159 start_codon:yes stop_codon:yes gene_type:complete
MDFSSDQVKLSLDKGEITTDKILLKNGKLNKSQIDSNDFKNGKSLLIKSKIL